VPTARSAGGAADLRLISKAVIGVLLLPPAGQAEERLLQERGFRAVAAEADWPGAYRVNRRVLVLGKDRSPDQAHGDFLRLA
jgi:hypothetical protein